MFAKTMRETGRTDTQQLPLDPFPQNTQSKRLKFVHITTLTFGSQTIFNYCAKITSNIYRTVRMMFRTHLTKGDSKELMVGKERMKEVVLEEHLDCGCQCAGVQEARCRGEFNQVTLA